ncbi:hypothetical protein, partial [Candidatus Burkholderia verschuerenii]|uniref:hypothetical protein n=1 Tax=Candidatus Burkholderia verschuerenii TaxID=242163 RepID=UPI000AF97DDC
MDFSPRAINNFFCTPNDLLEEFSRVQGSSDVEELTTVLTGSPKQLDKEWGAINKADLTPQARLLNAFINSRLMPIVVNWRVLRKRTELIYAILKGYSVNIGQVINQEIKETIKKMTSSNQQVLGFPSLIFQLLKYVGLTKETYEGNFMPAPTILKLQDFGRVRGRAERCIMVQQEEPHQEEDHRRDEDREEEHDQEGDQENPQDEERNVERHKGESSRTHDEWSIFRERMLAL